MKKILALVLVLALLCCSALTLAETATETMTLYLTGLSQDGETILNPADFGMTMAITLNPDGTLDAVSTGAGEESTTQGTWTENEDSAVLTIDGADLIVTPTEDGTGFVAAMDDLYYYFGFEPAVSSVVLANTIAADDITAFDGTWTWSSLSAYGMTISIQDALDMGLGDMLGATVDNLDLVIDNGSVSIFGKDAIPFNFADGALAFSLGDEELNLDQSIELCEDGSLKYTVMGMDLYFIAK